MKHSECDPAEFPTFPQAFKEFLLSSLELSAILITTPKDGPILFQGLSKGQ